MEASTLIYVAGGLLTLITIPSVGRIANKFKRMQQWNLETRHDRAGERELKWYWRLDDKSVRGLRAKAHSASNHTV
jgi:hypothetical protein